MVIIPVTGAFLIQSPSPQLAADFLPNPGVAHKDQTEEKATQVSEVSDAASCPRHGRIKFEKPVDDDEVLGRNREEKVDIDEPIWEKPSKGQEDSVNGSGGPDYRNELVG